MKIIFLDVDGVLNSVNTKERLHGLIGIEEAKVKLLKEIVDATDAKIVLTSTWKHEWFPYAPLEEQPKDGKYLLEKLSAQGLELLTKTYEAAPLYRGQGILDFLDTLPAPPESFVILDDESFDYKELNLIPKLVKTKFYPVEPGDAGGLRPEAVQQAIDILNKKETE